MSDIKDAIQKLRALVDFERDRTSIGRLDLRNTHALLKAVGGDPRTIRSVHISGSKGKGSTATAVANCLSASGVNTGLYLSPHVHRLNERIVVDGVQISDGNLARLVESVLERARAQAVVPTYYETLFACAVLYFSECELDMVVWETGIGGRLDSTVVCAPVVCGITPIELDHTDVLGSSLGQIAFEKAGIIKPGVPIVSAPQPTLVEDVLRRRAREMDSKFMVGDELVRLIARHPSKSGQQLIYRGDLGEYRISTSLLGSAQAANLGQALAILEVLASMGVRVDKSVLPAALGATMLPARGTCVRIASGKYALFDGCHTVGSATALREVLDSHFGGSPALIVFGATSGHDHVGTARALARSDDRFICVKSAHPRALPAEHVASSLRQAGLVVEAVTEDLQQAWDQAVQADCKMVVGCGSMFVAGDLSAMVKKL